MNEWINLGYGDRVRREEVIAITAVSDDSATNVAGWPYHPNLTRSLVLLRGGHVIPAYASVRALRRRLEQEGSQS